MKPSYSDMLKDIMDNNLARCFVMPSHRFRPVRPLVGETYMEFLGPAPADTAVRVEKPQPVTIKFSPFSVIPDNDKLARLLPRPRGYSQAHWGKVRGGHWDALCRQVGKRLRGQIDGQLRDILLGYRSVD